MKKNTSNKPTVQVVLWPRGDNHWIDVLKTTKASISYLPQMKERTDPIGFFPDGVFVKFGEQELAITSYWNQNTNSVELSIASAYPSRNEELRELIIDILVKNGGVVGD